VAKECGLRYTNRKALIMKAVEGSMVFIYREVETTIAFESPFKPKPECHRFLAIDNLDYDILLGIL
jgi:hypothetical protein